MALNDASSANDVADRRCNKADMSFRNSFTGSILRTTESDVWTDARRATAEWVLAPLKPEPELDCDFQCNRRQLFLLLHSIGEHMKAQQLRDNEAIGDYDRWAPVYDIVFGPIFHRGRRAAIEAAERIGGRILEVGIGTGIALRDYSPKNRIVGIDISPQMLEKARARVSELRLTHVEQLSVMDACNLEFPDNSFDVVMAQYVVSTVPRPEATLDEFARVLKPGGEIILASRLSEESGIRRSIEHFVAPAARKLGWRTEFGWERYLAWEARTPCIELVERRKMPPLGHFALIRFRKKETPQLIDIASGRSSHELSMPQ